MSDGQLNLIIEKLRVSKKKITLLLGRGLINNQLSISNGQTDGRTRIVEMQVVNFALLYVVIFYLSLISYYITTPQTSDQTF